MSFGLPCFTSEEPEWYEALRCCYFGSMDVGGRLRAYSSSDQVQCSNELQSCRLWLELSTPITVI